MSKVGKSYKKTTELRTGLSSETDTATLVTVNNPSPSGEDFNLVLTEMALALGVGKNNVTIIQELDDFPAPVGGVITLQSGYIYEINGVIDLGDNRIEIGGSSGLFGEIAGHDGLTYTGAGTMFTAVDGDITTIRNLSLSCSNGTLLNTTGDGVGDGVDIQGCSLVSVNSLGNIDDAQLFSFKDCFVFGVTDGFTFTGPSGGRFVVSGNTILNTVNTMFSLGTAIYQNYVIENNQSIVTPSGGVFLSGSAASANVGVGGAIEGNIFSGDGDVLSTITKQDLKWEVSGNKGLSDTETDAEIFISSSAETTISSASTPVLIAGTYSEVDANNFTITAGGRITYTGLEAMKLSVMATMNAEMSSGGSKLCMFYIAKNGSVISSSAMANELASTAVRVTSLQSIVTFETGDYVEVFASNEDDTTNITVERLTLVAR